MRRPAWVDDELYPFASQWHEGIHYVDEGPAHPRDAPVLLFLHGNPTWSFLYRDVVRGLSDRFRCVVPDLPGFGLSIAPPGATFRAAEHAERLEAFVAGLDLRDVTLVIQDWGGPIGMRVAGRMPERFARFVVLNTWAWPMRKPAGVAFSKALGGPVGRRVIAHRNAFVEWIIPLGTRTALPDAVMEMYRRPFPTVASRKPTWVFPQEITAAAGWLGEVEAGLDAVRDRPALIVWPDSDPAFGTAERDRWRSVFADHRLVELEGARHYCQEDAPREIVAAVRDWLS